MFYLGLAAFTIVAIVVVLILTYLLGYLGTLIGGIGSVWLGHWLFFSEPVAVAETVSETMVETESLPFFTNLQTELSPLMEYFLTDIAMTFIGIILFGLFVFFAEAERLWSSVILIVVALLAAQFLAGIAVLTVLFTNPVLLVAGVLAYIVGGGVFTAWWEWPDYCKKNADPKALDNFLERYKEDGLTEDDYYASPYQFKLHPKNHITRLGHMILHWPFLLFWTLSHDPITWFYNFMCDLLSGFLHRTAVKVTKAAVQASKPKAGTEV